MPVFHFLRGEGVTTAYGVTHSVAAAAFDRVASTYDESFTRTLIGRAQRRQVWSRLLAAFAPGSRILELNCGTGEDAGFLVSRGRSVVACDASEAMIAIARQKQPQSTGASLVYRHVANEDLSPLCHEDLFDGAFSNFSGLNCLGDLKPFAQALSNLVRPQARVLVCLWGRLCMTELFWFLLHGQPRKAVRRFSGRATASLGALSFSVTYPSVGEIRSAFSPWFRLTSRRAVGLLVPPSYVEKSISGRHKLLARLEWLDRVFAAWPALRDCGDHTLLEFVRCNP